MTPQALADLVVAMIEANKLDAKGRTEFLGLLATKVLSTSEPRLSIDSERAAASATPTPPKIEAGGAVWITAGTECKCKACHKLIYRVVKDVPERVKFEDFEASFQPLNGAPVIPEGVEIYGDPYGNLAIDCTLCKGKKSLWIRGDGDYDAQPDTKDTSL